MRQFSKDGMFARITLVLVIAVLSLAGGCASFPKKELQEAEDAIAEARSSEAERFAPAEWKAAQSTQQEAESLANSGEFDEAREKAIAAKAAAVAAVDAAEKNREIFEENERKRKEEEARRAAEEAARLQAEKEAAEAAAAEAAEKDPFGFEEGEDPFASEFDEFSTEEEAAAGAGAGETETTEEELAFQEETLAEPEPMPAGPYTGETRIYQVQRYDTLAKVAAQPDVYGDGDLWYILYDANRDVIKDPDLLPRVEIVIPLSPTDAQKEEARRINREHVPNLWDGM